MGVLPGLGLFDAHTIHGGAEVGAKLKTLTDARTVRQVGNLVVQWGEHVLVGFENHGGRTYLGPTARPLGKVLMGGGNNGKDGLEGAVYRNAIGTYLHGPGLPKNPALADWLIGAGLARRFGPVELAPLDDELELEANHAALRNMARKGDRDLIRTHRRFSRLP